MENSKLKISEQRRLEIKQRNKEIADKKQEIEEAQKRGATEQELFLLKHQLGVLVSVGNPSITYEQKARQFRKESLVAHITQ